MDLLQHAAPPPPSLSIFPSVHRLRLLRFLASQAALVALCLSLACSYRTAVSLATQESLSDRGFIVVVRLLPVDYY